MLSINQRTTTLTEVFPEGFPRAEFQQRQALYQHWWSWFNGQRLLETVEREGGVTDYLYPLRLNIIELFAEKLAFMMLGEVPDGVEPPFKTQVTPRPKLKLPKPVPVKTLTPAKPPGPTAETGDFDTDREQSIPAPGLQPQPKVIDAENDRLRSLSIAIEWVINQVWSQSNGRSIQFEGAILQQFLGGCVFQLCWEPQDVGLDIPIKIKHILPDYFCPVYRSDNYELLEVYITYKITAQEARARFGYKADYERLLRYVEHWTATQYTIYIEGDVVAQEIHDWGFVPFYYIPAGRVGDFWGRSIVPGHEGIAEELNARISDTGDTVKAQIDYPRYMRNVPSVADIEKVHLADGVYAINLGTAPSTYKHVPEVYAEPPPALSEPQIKFYNDLWDIAVRFAHLTPVSFGDDEGSQRSALTLAARMQSTIAKTRYHRAGWQDGLSLMARHIAILVIRYMSVIQDVIPEFPDYTEEDLRKLSFMQDLPSQIPQERTATVQEVVSRKGSGLLSVRTGLEMLGDITDVEAEIERIVEDQQRSVAMQQQSFGAKQNAPDGKKGQQPSEKTQIEKSNEPPVKE